jgi:hypothetical protein
MAVINTSAFVFSKSLFNLFLLLIGIMNGEHMRNIKLVTAAQFKVDLKNSAG